MKRLVILARKLDPGGAERQLVALARGFKARGHDVHVVLFYAGGVYDAELAASGVPVHFLGKRSRWDALTFLLRLARLLRDLRPDSIYSFLDVPNILVAILRGFAGKPRLIWSIRAAGMDMRHYDWLSRAIPKVEARLSAFADTIIANSHAGADWAKSRGFPAQRLQVVENGIDTVRFCPDVTARARVRAEWGVSAGECLIGLVARLDPMKDHPNFLKACAALAARRASLRFVCVGGGEAGYLEELKTQAEQLGIGARMVWAGPRRDMPAIYNALDVSCSSSAFGEGFSNAIGESMSCGVPCVVTDVGDSARIVMEFGEVVSPHDCMALAEALERMLCRIKREPDLGRRARERVETEFSVAKMLACTERIVSGLA